MNILTYSVCVSLNGTVVLFYNARKVPERKHTLKGLHQNTHFDTAPSWVPGADLFSNRFLADLERIWALRYYIPDPNRPDYSENI